jgi:glutathione S-transferase
LAGQSRTPEFLAKNSSGGVPVLELDDGSHLSESVAICRYLEGLHLEPNLLGRDLREQAEIERWNRRMELELFAAIGRTFQNTSPIFQGRFKQSKRQCVSDTTAHTRRGDHAGPANRGDAAARSLSLPDMLF